MSKLNPKNTEHTIVAKKLETGEMTLSYNGNPQFRKTPEFQLFELATASFFDADSFYESANTRMKRATELLNQIVSKGNAHYVANMLVFARTVMNMRTMPVALTVHFAKALRANNVQYASLRQVVRDVIQRPDEITDMLAYAIAQFGDKNKVPAALKKGVGDALNKFDEYRLQKYQRSEGVKYSDVLRIVHPKPKNEVQAEIFNKIMAESDPKRTEKLAQAQTWEFELSRNGALPKDEQETKAEIWSRLVKENKLGYMAMLRNLRNIVEAGVEADVINIIANKLSNPDEVKKSKQLPFRFINAQRALEDSGLNVPQKIKSAITKALDSSFSNTPELGKNVWLILDVSGSMTSFPYYSRFNGNPRNNNTFRSPLDMAALFTAAMVKNCESVDNLTVTLFSDSAKHISLNPHDSIETLHKNILKSSYGGGTNLQAALDQKKGLGYEPDTVIVFSDMQVNRLSGYHSTKIFGKDCIKLAYNFETYESTPLAEDAGWYQLTGFSDKVFSFVNMMREGTSIVEALSQQEYVGLKIKNLVKTKNETEEE